MFLKKGNFCVSFTEIKIFTNEIITCQENIFPFAILTLSRNVSTSHVPSAVFTCEAVEGGGDEKVLVMRRMEEMTVVQWQQGLRREEVSKERH